LSNQLTLLDIPISSTTAWLATLQVWFSGHASQRRRQDILLKAFRMNGISHQAAADLYSGFAVLEEINDGFCQVAAELLIWSFYETKQSKFALSRSLMLEATMYPGETVSALVANYCDMCKFESPNDANYLQVLSGLKSIITQSFQGLYAIYKPLRYERIEVWPK
jgi:hypothetical protein